MARRRSSVQDFLTNFNMAYRLGSQVAQDIELGRIADAKPEFMQVFTTEDADQLRAAADSGQYDIGIKTKEDGTFAGYTVTPKSDPSQTGTIGMQGVTDFLGQRTAGTMTQDQVDAARQRAMAGVVMRDDPVRGMGMMRDITRDERDAERYGWEKSRNERQIRLDQEADADKALLKQVDTEVGDWFNRRLANPDGTQRAATVDDHLAASQYRASRLMAAGKTDAAGQVMKDYNAQSLVKIQLESAQRTEALGKTAAALAAGDLGAVRDFYNQYIPDGARVTDVKQGADGSIVIQRERLDGTPLPPTTMKDTGQLLAALTTFKDPMALYNWSQNEFKNNLAIKADARAERADARAGAAAARTAAEDARIREEAKAKADAAVALFKERNPNATPAELEAVRRQILKPHTGEGGEITSDYKPDAVGMGGTAIQKDKAGNLVVTKIGPDGKVGQPMVIRPPGSDSTPKFASMAEAEAAVKAGKIKPGDRVTIGGRTAVWMPDAAAPAPAPAPARSSPASQPVASPAPVAQTPPSAPPQAAAPRSVASVLGVGKTQDSALNAIMASKAQAIESAASDLKTAQAQFAAVARSGDKAATAEYQRRVVAAQQRLNALLGPMNEALAAQVRRSLGI